jgi:hypothetical protein
MDLAATGQPTAFTDDDQICEAFFEAIEYFANDKVKHKTFDDSPQINEFFLRCGKKFRDGVRPSNAAEKRCMKVIGNTAKSLNSQSVC